ncbi:MAG: M56 family metallopeptidase [Planctomycetota bacterium]
MNSWMDSQWLTQAGWILLHSGWQFTLISIVVYCFNRLLFASSAKTQYWLSCFGLVTIAVCPIVTWNASVKQSASLRSRPAVESGSPVGGPHAMSMPLAGIDSVSGSVPRQVINRNRSDQFGEVPTAPFHIAVRPLPVIGVIWLCGLAVFSMRPVLGVVGQYQLRRRGRPASADLSQRLARTAARMRVPRRVKIAVTQELVGPVVIGVFRPMILVPVALVTNLSARELDVLLAHELAHLQRHDSLVNAIQVLLETVFFYHPAVWWLSREVRQTREYCCDELATTDAGSRVDLGRALLALETRRSLSVPLTLAATDGDLLKRIRRLAQDNPPRIGPSRVRVVFGFGILVSLVLFTSSLPAREAPPSDAGQQAVGSTGQQPNGDLEDIRVTDSNMPGQREEVTVESGDDAFWELDLEECVAIALNNATFSTQVTIRSFPDDGTEVGSQMVLSVDEEARVGELEVQVRNLVHEIEVAYWELDAAHQSTDEFAGQFEQLDRLLKRATEHLHGGTGTQQELEQVESAVHAADESLQTDQQRANEAKDRVSLRDREMALRVLMGLPETDGRLIRPSSKVVPVENLEREHGYGAAMERNAELKAQTRRLKKMEAELASMKEQLAKDLEIKVEKLWHPFEKGEVPRSVSVSKIADSSEDIETFSWKIGARREFARIRRYQIEVGRSKEFVDEMRKTLRHVIDEHESRSASLTRLSQTEAMRVRASEQEVKVRWAEYEKGLTPVQILLQSLERYGEAKQSYRRSLTEYAKSMSLLRMARGTSLDQYGIQVKN